MVGRHIVAMLVGYAHAAAARRAGARLARRAGRPSRPRGGRRGPRWRGLRRGQTKARCARARSARTRAREAGEEEWVVAGRWERRGGESGSSTRGSGGWLGRGLGRQRPAGSLRGSGTKRTPRTHTPFTLSGLLPEEGSRRRGPTRPQGCAAPRRGGLAGRRWRRRRRRARRARRRRRRACERPSSSCSACRARVVVVAVVLRARE